MNKTGRVALLRDDQRRRWLEGQRLPAETYLQQEPALQANPEAVLELIYNEIVLREEVGDPPLLDEYVKRFPQYAEQLRIQFEIHLALEEAALASESVFPPEGSPTLKGGLAETVSPQSVTVPGYEILGELGRGGMGVVYRARQLDLKRVVALKMILAGAHAGPRELALFRTEAEAVARLQHPNIVQIYAVGEVGGLPFFSLEFVHGPSLEDRIGSSHLAPEQAACLVEVLARAMHHVHQHGIIHRDLKPGNVLLARSDRPDAVSVGGAGGTERWEPKITDFGLAKLLDAEGSDTPTEAPVGTPSYMAPEQAGGASNMIGPAADIYSLGAILYQLLAGRPPFQGETALDTLAQVRFREPPPPSRFQVSVAGEVETICLKCLEKDPRRRYGTAQDLAEDLGHFLAGEPIQARPVAGWERLWKWARRRPAAACLAAVSVVAVLALGLLALWHRWDVRAKENQALMQAHREESTRLQAARANYQAFVRRRDDALFYGIYGTLFTDVDPAENLKATQSAGQEALAAFHVEMESGIPPAPDPYLSDRENADIAAGWYQLLLVMAEAVATPVPKRSPEDQRRQVGRALQVLEGAVRLVPPTQAYHLRKARYLVLLGDVVGASRERTQAAQVEPVAMIDFFLLGDEHFRQRDIAQAVRDFQNALRLQPDDFWSHFFLAFCHLKMGRPADAQAHLEECLKQRPRFLWSYLLSSFVKEKLEAFDAAEADYQSILALDPNKDARYFVYMNRGRLRFQQGNIGAAAADLNQAVLLRPDLFIAHLFLARVYQVQKKLDDSDRQLAVTIQLRPPSPFLAQCHTERGRNLYLGKKFEDAVAACDEALKILPGDADSQYLRGRALLEIKRYQEALRSFHRFLDAGGKAEANFYRGCGQARFQLRDYLGAVDDYTHVLEAEPDPEIYLHRGWAFYFTDALKPALRDFDEAVRRDPNNGAAHVGRGLCRVMLGSYGPALADADQALDLIPDMPEMMHNIACVFALAAARVENDQTAVDRHSLARHCQKRAVETIGRTLAMVPPGDRPRFWRDKIHPDPALDAIRPCTEFKHWETEFGTLGPAR